MHRRLRIQHNHRSPMKYQFVTFLMMCVIIISCTNAKELYEKGKYTKAYDTVLPTVSKKGNKQDKILLNKAFSKMIDSVRQKQGACVGNSFDHCWNVQGLFIAIFYSLGYVVYYCAGCYFAKLSSE